MDSIRDILAARGIQIPSGIPIPTSCDTNSKEYILARAKAANRLEGSLTGYECQRCKNRGFYSIVREREDIPGTWEEVTKECECMPARRELARIKASGLEKLANKKTFRNYNADEEWKKRIKEAGKKYADDSPRSWFYIGGQPGCGKTHICAAIGMELLKKGRAVRYMVWPDENPKLKAYVNEISFESLIAPYKTVDVLYIDDFFKTKKDEPISTADVNMAFRIINYRYNAELATIISSEFSLTQIIGIDQALGSRIVEMTEPKYNLYIGLDPKKNYRFKNT